MSDVLVLVQSVFRAKLANMFLSVLGRSAISAVSLDASPDLYARVGVCLMLPFVVHARCGK
jgi:hypothetical protein